MASSTKNTKIIFDQVKFEVTGGQKRYTFSQNRLFSQKIAIISLTIGESGVK